MDAWGKPFLGWGHKPGYCQFPAESSSKGDPFINLHCHNMLDSSKNIMPFTDHSYLTRWVLTSFQVWIGRGSEKFIWTHVWLTLKPMLFLLPFILLKISFFHRTYFPPGQLQDRTFMLLIYIQRLLSVFLYYVQDKLIQEEFWCLQTGLNVNFRAKERRTLSYSITLFLN